MATMNVAEQLLSGSNEIARMQADIHKFVKMLTSAVYMGEMHELIPNMHCEQKEMPSGSTWILSRLADGLEVTCNVKTSYGEQLGYSDTTKRFLIPSVTQPVYDSLPEFAEWMFELFPKLKDRLRPFFNAAAAKEAREAQKTA